MNKALKVGFVLLYKKIIFNFLNGEFGKLLIAFTMPNFENKRSAERGCTSDSDSGPDFYPAKKSTSVGQASSSVTQR